MKLKSQFNLYFYFPNRHSFKFLQVKCNPTDKKRLTLMVLISQATFYSPEIHTQTQVIYRLQVRERRVSLMLIPLPSVVTCSSIVFLHDSLDQIQQPLVLHFLLFYYLNFCRTKIPFCGSTGTLCFGLRMTLPVGFKARVDSPLPTLLCITDM